MGDEPPDTSKLCPSCGLAESHSRLRCHLCGGTGLVDSATWARWHARRAQPGTTRSSTSIRASNTVENLIEKLAADGTAKAYGLSVRGQRLLDMIAQWSTRPVDGKVQQAVYVMVSDWLDEASKYLEKKPGP